MVNTRHHPILNYLRQVLGTPSAGGVSDADLLRRFVDRRDEAAFELLLWRHAAMVLHVCRQVLGNADAVDDAFQATFLVLVRKAGSISRREALGAWLYRVAYHIALKARSRIKTRPTVPADLDVFEARKEDEDADQRELRRILCEEVNRLPAKYRAVIVACFFEGKTHEEAAHQLGWPRGTVAGRVARARELLRRRLLRLGITLSMSALLTALTVRTAQAALTGLVDSVIHTARLLAAGQTASAVVAPQVAALAEGVLQAMYWTKAKIAVVVLFLTTLGGAGVTLWATQEQEQQLRLAQEQQRRFNQPASWPTLQPQSTGPATALPAQVSAEEDDPPEVESAEENAPEDAAKLARDMARSRVNLKNLALGMHNYNDVYTQLPRAIMDKNGKALLSWRVALLPFIEQQELYRQFKLEEPWDSPHNKKLLSKMPAIYAPPGVKTRRPYSTFYQVFVSAGPPAGGEAAGGAGGPGMMGGGAGGAGMGMPGGGPGAAAGGASRPSQGGPPGGMMQKMGAQGGAGGSAMKGMSGRMGPMMQQMMGGLGGAEHSTAAFVKGEATRIPASFPDGTSNTILIIEAGNPVPWTKPEDLHYAGDEPLPELGGLFPNVIHAAFADGAVHTLRKNYNEQQLRLAITANDGMLIDMAKLQVPSRRRAGAVGGRASIQDWQQKNDELRKELEQARRQIRLLKEEQEVERELAAEDPRITQLKEDHARLQAELKKLRSEIESLKKGMKQPRKPNAEPNDPQGFIDRLWPNLDTTRLEENIPKAQNAFNKCKEAGDLVSIHMLLKGTEAHAKQLSKQLAELHPDLVIDDEKEARKLTKVSERIVKLAREMQEYLKVHSDDR